MLEPTAPVVQAPVTQAPATPKPTPTPQPAAKAPGTGEAPPAEDVDAGEVGDAGVELGFLDEAPEGAEEGQQEGEPARQTVEEREADTPESPDGYEIEVPGLDARNDPIVQSFTGVVHELGISNSEANALAGWFIEQNQQMHEQRLEADKADRAQVLKQTTKAWGASAPANQAAVRQALSAMSPELRSAVKTARANPNGPLLLHQPEFLNLLAQVGRRDAGSTQQRQSQNAGAPLYQVQADIDAIRRVMKDDSEYFYRHKLDQKLLELEQQKAALTPQAPAPRPLRGDAQREAAILKIMRSDWPRYEREHLSAEYAAILQRKAGRS